MYQTSKARTESPDVISAIFSLSQPLGHPDVLRGRLPLVGLWFHLSWKKGAEILRATAMQIHFIVFQPSSHLC